MSHFVKYVRDDLIGSTLDRVNSWLPNLSDHRLQSNTFNKLAVIVGFFTTVSLTFKALKAVKYLASGLHSFDKSSIKNVYGEGSWAIIGDIQTCQNQAQFLAAKGLNLILMGDEDTLKQRVEGIRNVNRQIEVETYPVNWQKEETQLPFYDALLARFQHYDISILIAPKVPRYAVGTFGPTSEYPLCQHIFLLVNTFLKKLKWRAHRSAIIIYSDKRNQSIESGAALQNGAVSAVDAFGRYLGYQVKDYCDVVVVRKGNTHQIFDALGYRRIVDYSKPFF